MSDLFMFLLLVSIVCFIIGLISPEVFSKWLGKSVNRKRIALVFGGLAVACFILTGASASPSENKPKEKPAQTTDIVQEKKKPVIEIKEETKTEEVAFETTTKDDSTLDKGQTKVQQEGKNGTKEIKYKVTYTDGKETNREKVSESITVQPVNKVILNGTKVQPTVITTPSQGDGYTNVDGNYVPSPGSNPFGATAVCADGTYSYSQHRSGTCSHHGGVAEWL
jgi:membrane protein implicated in regulation of membrane protease activity